jgi:DNA-binding MarR family transcriptional regulator
VPSTTPAPPVLPGDAAQLGARLRLVIGRLARRWRQEGRAPDPELTQSRLSALVSIERDGPITLGDLAAIEQVQPPSMTRIVASLEDLGLARREVDPGDRRVARVRITPEGGRRLSRFRNRKDAFVAMRVARLTDEERAALAIALPVLEQLLDEGAE